uniref:Putative tumor necrosis factor induced protein darlingi n=1 Tax=Xenopsylla cheopis TaxID=163159 RepID=A0A6M2DHQ1_XENCH
MLDTVMTDNAFKAQDIGLRAQKKILSRMATKSVAKVFIDGVTSSLLDNVYRLLKQYTGNKKEAEKIVKNIIKIVIKVGVLHRNYQFNNEELNAAHQFQNKFKNLKMSIISFYEVDYSFDLPYLQKTIRDCQNLLIQLVQRHLTDKSVNRIQDVFGFFNEPKFLESAFKSDSPYREIMGKIVSDMNKAIENGDL